MLEYWVWLAQRPSLSERVKWNLVMQFGSPDAVYSAEAEELRAVDGMTEDGLASLEDHALGEAQDIVSFCSSKGVGILTCLDPEYPARLKNIYDPPILLYYKGTLPDFDSVPVIAVVGTRKASVYGLANARRMGYEIAACGGMVVSGLADGADGAAMAGALAANRPAVGVLGCGIDIVYPKSNRSLYRDTVRYGCILTEYAPGVPPMRWHFPRRNRIMSGLSCGVLVTEAPLKSGSLITANYAAEQGRDVFVIPGNVGVASCEGSNRLLREGGIAVTSGWDVVSEYEAHFPGLVRRDETEVPPPEEADSPEEAAPEEPKTVGKKKKSGTKQAIEEKSIDKEPSAPYIDLSRIGKKLNADEKAVVEAIGTGEVLVDDIIAASGLSAGRVLCAMTTLEMKRVIVRYPGRRVSLKP